MVQRPDAAEHRARGNRLIIIFVVVFVLLGGGLTWRLLTNRALANKSEAAMSELRKQWRPIDLAELNRQYSMAVTEANASGNYGAAHRLFPHTQESGLFTAEFRSGRIVAAKYVVSASGREPCLSMLISGPTPNRIEIRQQDGDC